MGVKVSIGSVMANVDGKIESILKNITVVHANRGGYILSKNLFTQLDCFIIANKEERAWEESYQQPILIKRLILGTEESDGVFVKIERPDVNPESCLHPEQIKLIEKNYCNRKVR